MVAPALCGRCGAPIAPGAGFCSFCGVAFVGAGGAAGAVGAGPAASGREGEIVELLRRGDKISAIKLHRELHHTGLREAKDAVEALEKRLGL